ncbi:MAG: hypothetical protein DME15_16505 [Candidatus Rokuibacteriota bacterium]|nr:MAG: hypothetical protein DME15_16505 [Candidatus Rokubacteria bacterium]
MATFLHPSPDPNTGVYTTSDYIRGTLRIADAVFRDVSTTYDASMVLAYSFTDGHQTLTNGDSTIVSFRLHQDDLRYYPYTNAWSWSLAFANADVALSMVHFGEGTDHGVIEDRARLGTPNGDGLCCAVVTSSAQGYHAGASPNTHFYYRWTVEHAITALAIPDDAPVNVPEPATWLLLLVGVIGLGVVHKSTTLLLF